VPPSGGQQLDVVLSQGNIPHGAPSARVIPTQGLSRSDVERGTDLDTLTARQVAVYLGSGRVAHTALQEGAYGSPELVSMAMPGKQVEDGDGAVADIRPGVGLEEVQCRPVADRYSRSKR
jgi:hypothetical protein